MGATAGGDAADTGESRGQPGSLFGLAVLDTVAGFDYLLWVLNKSGLQN